jgi:hypothetical protein
MRRVPCSTLPTMLHVIRRPRPRWRAGELTDMGQEPASLRVSTLAMLAWEAAEAVRDGAVDHASAQGQALDGSHVGRDRPHHGQADCRVGFHRGAVVGDCRCTARFNESRGQPFSSSDCAGSYVLTAPE